MISKIGITGHSGSLGTLVIKYKSNLKYTYFKGDIQNKSQINSWLKKNKPTAVIHLAAIVPIKQVNKNKLEAYRTNYLGTKNLVDASLKNNIKWFFFSSTSHVYSSTKKKILESTKIKPCSYYGQTKLLAENYIRKKLKNKIKFSIGRIFSTTNKNQKKNYLIPDLKKKANKKKKYILENLNHYRDFVSMEDTAKIIHLLYEKKYNGIINIGLGKPVLLKDIAKIIFKKKNKIARFKDNKKPTYLIANNKKLKKIINFRLQTSLLKMIY